MNRSYLFIFLAGLGLGYYIGKNQKPREEIFMTETISPKTDDDGTTISINFEDLPTNGVVVDYMLTTHRYIR